MQEIIDHELTKKYPNFLSHLERQYLDRKEKWALYYRYCEELPTHNVQTSNYVEASFRVRKDIQFNRTKAYNLPDLLDILLDNSDHTRKKLIDVGNGRFEQIHCQQSRYNGSQSHLKIHQVTEICEQIYMIESEKNADTFYMVDMKSGYCDCPTGLNKGPCKKLKPSKNTHCMMM